MTVLDRTLAVLQPVRRALLEDATAEGQRLLAGAREDADALVAAARGEVDEAVERARRRAEASAAARRDESLAAARRAAHEAVLGARADLHRLVVQRVHEAVDTMVDDPRYPMLLAHLIRTAHEQLGDDAVITCEPGGGIVASTGPRSVDYRLSALADRAIEAAAEEVAALWS